MIPLGVVASAHVPAASGGGFTFAGMAASYPGAPDTTNTVSVPVGTYTAGRTVVLAAWHGIVSSDTAMSMTVDSVAATEDIEYGGALSNRHNLMVCRAQPTGTTCSVQVATGATGFVVVYAWTYPGALTFGAAGGNFAAGAPSRSVTLPSGGFGVAIASHRDAADDAATWSWSAATLADSGPWTSAATITASGTVSSDSALSSSTALVTATYSPA